jgi:hypothetical protein
MTLEQAASLLDAELRPYPWYSDRRRRDTRPAGISLG